MSVWTCGQPEVKALLLGSVPALCAGLSELGANASATSQTRIHPVHRLPVL